MDAQIAAIALLTNVAKSFPELLLDSVQSLCTLGLRGDSDTSVKALRLLSKASAGSKDVASGKIRLPAAMVTKLASLATSGTPKQVSFSAVRRAVHCTHCCREGLRRHAPWPAER